MAHWNGYAGDFCISAPHMLDASSAAPKTPMNFVKVSLDLPEKLHKRLLAETKKRRGAMRKAGNRARFTKSDVIRTALSVELQP